MCSWLCAKFPIGTKVRNPGFLNFGHNDFSAGTTNKRINIVFWSEIKIEGF